MPIEPVSPRPIEGPPRSPLERSGLNLLDVFGEPDSFVVRDATQHVELDVGLEQARGSMVRNQPADALAALDRVWDGARTTEEGWYVRGGSLTLLGLPGEAERVVAAAIESRPTSSALRFLQSVARLALGDVAGARGALGAALQIKPSDPLLLVQQALVVARQGDRLTANAMLARAATLAPEHPAIVYGRTMIRVAQADAARFTTSGNWAAIVEQPGAESVASDWATKKTTPASNDQVGANRETDNDAPRSFAPTTDIATDAFRRLGARVVVLADCDVAAETRMLLRAFSAGGTLVATVNAESAHSARSVLAAMTDVLAASADDRVRDALPRSLNAIVREVLVALRAGHTELANEIVRKSNGAISEPVARYVRELIAGVVPESRDGASERPNAPADIRGGEHDRTPLASLRLGLALLPDERAQALAFTSAAIGTMPASTDAQAIESQRYAGQVNETAPGTLPYGSDAAPGWGAAVVGTLTSKSVVGGAQNARMLAIVCVAIAFGAFAIGYPVVGMALAGGAAWLALRRGSGDSRAADDSPGR